MVKTSNAANSLLLAALLVACSSAADPGGSTEPDVTVASVAVTASAASVEVGATTQLAATAKNAAGTSLAGKSFSWGSSNSSTATVDASTGLVTGVAAGSVTITATEGGSGKAGSVTLNVLAPAVAVVTVSPASATVGIGQTQQLTVALADARGAPITGRPVTWSTSDAAVATVSDGVVTGVASGGPVTITATIEGKSGTAEITVPAIPVATVAINTISSPVLQGSTTQLSATLKDASGAVLTGRPIAWSSSNSAIAAVSSEGVLTAAAAGGPVTITATAEGQSGTAQVTVIARTATRVAVAPRFAVVNVAADQTLTAEAFDAANVSIPAPAVARSTESAATATVAAGVVRGVAEGKTLVAAKVDAAADTAAIAVLGPTGVLSTAFVGGAYSADAKPGQTISVVVALDLSRPSATGDLGAAQLELTYDAAVFTFVSAEANASGSSHFNSPSPGRFLFSMAHTSAQGSGAFSLVTVTLQVTSGAPVGEVRSLGLSYAGPLTSTSFQNYSAPVTVGGRVRIIAQ